jgi:NAD(P)-dependent dehydrogenase (short-subunit alcohol dehydrogenase family)
MAAPHQLVALVSGAGSGIGRAIAVQLSYAGYFVALVGRRPDPLHETLTLLKNGNGLVLQADLGDVREARRCVRECVAATGRLDALINNAGLGRVVAIGMQTDDLLRETFAINAFAPASMILEAWPTFAAQHAATGRGGCIVNISSMATVDPFPGFFGYAASKAALNSMAASIAKEGEAIAVRAFAVAPGAVETSMLRAAFNEDAIARDQCLAPESAARVVLACVRGERDHWNGRTIPVLPKAAKAWYAQWVREHPPILE